MIRLHAKNRLPEPGKTDCLSSSSSLWLEGEQPQNSPQKIETSVIWSGHYVHHILRFYFNLPPTTAVNSEPPRLWFLPCLRFAG